MYYIAKIAQATGLGIIAFEFIRHFPGYASRNVLILGTATFVFGWVIQRFMLRR